LNPYAQSVLNNIHVKLPNTFAEGSTQLLLSASKEKAEDSSEWIFYMVKIFVIGTIISFSLSFLLHHAFEMPIMRLTNSMFFLTKETLQGKKRI